MENRQDEPMKIEAALLTPRANTHIIDFNFGLPIDHSLVDNDAHWVDLSLTPRLSNARACYPEHWCKEQFEDLGEIYLIPSGQELHARGDRGGHKSILCLLPNDPDYQGFTKDIEWNDQNLRSTLNIRNESIRNLLLKLGQETQYPGFASEAMAELLASQLHIELARHFLALDEEPEHRGQLSQGRLRLIDERLMDLVTPPSVTELSELCNLSARQLSRAFKLSRGCTIGEYISKCRVERAKQLLAIKRCVKEVSYSTGFATPAAFSFAFKRATGETPTDFLRRTKKAH